MSNPTLTNGDTKDAANDSWWRSAVIYQVYIGSFADGDGTGDIAGLRSRLQYLAYLGVDAIWISPWHPSPPADGGYDVCDFRDINPAYGTTNQADRTSMLQLYRSALRLRRTNPDLRGEDFCRLDSPAGTLLFERGAGLLCAVNLSDQPIPLHDASSPSSRRDR